MMRKIIFGSVLFSFALFQITAMEPDAYCYDLSIRKIHTPEDAFKIKIRKQPKMFDVSFDTHMSREKCSLVANFSKHTCAQEKNLFAPFSTATEFKKTSATNFSDCFLWNIPDFGLLKLQSDGAVFFGHGAENAPLEHDDVTITSSGKLFLEYLKVAGLTIKSKEAQLCQAVVADRLLADHFVQNTGGLRTKNLLGHGEFLNEGILELVGNPQNPAILGIKTFLNKKNALFALDGRVQASHLHITNDNHFFYNGEGAHWNVSEVLLVQPMQPGLASSFINKGELKGGTLDLYRLAINKGFWQANLMKVSKEPFTNNEFGQVKILDGMSIESSLLNKGEIDAKRNITLTSGLNTGMITGSPELSLCVHNQMVNEGQVHLGFLSGEGVFKNHRSLFLNTVCTAKIQTLINQTLSKDKKAQIAGKGLFMQGGSFLNETDSEVCLESSLSFTSAQSWLGKVDTVPMLAKNKGSITAKFIDLFAGHGLENNGTIETSHITLHHSPLINLQEGSIHIKEQTSVAHAEINNAGSCTHEGAIECTAAQVKNTGNLIFTHGTMAMASSVGPHAPAHTVQNTTFINDGNWLWDRVTCSGLIDMENNGILQLKDSSLTFNQLTNNKDLLLHSGAYAVNTLKNKRIQFLENDWTITDDGKNVTPYRLTIVHSPRSQRWYNNFLGEIESQKNLLYDVASMPASLRAQGDVYCSDRYIRDLNDLKVMQTFGKVTASCPAVNLIEEPEANTAKEFPNIGHLELFVKGAFTSYYSFKAPTLSLHVAGPLVLGKSNEQLGTIAATHGPLTVAAHSIDGRYGKFYGKGKTLLESTQTDIIIGAPARGVDETIKQHYGATVFPQGHGSQMKCLQRARNNFDYTLDIMNGAYAASDNTLTLKSAANIFIPFGIVRSSLENNLMAQNEIQNMGGRISSDGTTIIQAAAYNHLRQGAAARPAGYEYPGSGPAILESLGKIDFFVKNIRNLASSIRSGQGIFINNVESLSKETGYIEEPQTFFHRYFNGHGWGTDWGHKCRVIFNQSCTTQSGDVIQMNLGNFVVTGSMSGQTISIQGHSGLFANNKLSRQTGALSHPLVVDVTAYLQEQARKPGMYRLGAHNTVETEFPLGTASRPQEGDLVLFENSARAAPLQWRNIFNPLSSINLDLHLQQLLANLAGKVYAGKAKGNMLATMLWANANKWRQQHNKDVMVPSDMQNITKSMLLAQILNNGITPQQQTLLCIAPEDINVYQDQGDIVTDTFKCVTKGDQTHLNNRIVASRQDGIAIKSMAGNVNLETQSYTVSSETKECKVVQQVAMPQQQLIAPSGPIQIAAHGDVSRTGTMIAAAGDVDEHAQTGSVIKKPLVLQTLVETRHEDRGLFSTTESTQTSLTHSVLPSITTAGVTLHDKAAVSIEAVASQDAAGQEIVYESPHTNIEGLIVANRTTAQSQSSSFFSEQLSFESKETPCATPATIKAPLVRFTGEHARVNADIFAHELRDETQHGVQFVAKVAQMLCSGQTLASTPLFSADVGYNAGYETMIAPMLMVEKIVRAQDAGHMLFESALMDKNRTKIIGKFVETTYQLKQWQTSWNHTTQVIPDEALVVVALGIGLATQGMGFKALAPLLKSITAATGMQLSAAGIAMVNAGFTTLCSSAGTSFLKTGSPIQALEQLVSPAQLKALAFNMASAGLCSQLGDMFKINMKPELKSLSAHVQEHALRSTVDTLMNIAINHAPVDAALSDACKHIPLKAVAAYAANQICTTYRDTIAQKTAHAMVGGLSGFAMDTWPKGFISGAVGALTAQTVGDVLLSDARAISHAAIAQLQAEGQPLTLENIQQAILEQVQVKTNIAKIAAGGVAAVAGQNPAIAIASATNAIDNDVAIRGSLYALAEFQAMVTAACQAFAILHAHEVQTEEVLDENINPKRNGTAIALEHETQDEMAHDLVLQTIQRPMDTYDDVIMQHAQEPLDKPQQQRSLHDRIVNPETTDFINESSNIIRIAFVDALSQTVNLFSMVPNPVGLACLAGDVGKDLYQGTTTPGEVIVNTALACGVLKGIQLTGKGIKILYQQGKGVAKDITDGVLNRLHQRKYASQGRLPFVENPRAGTWSNANISEDLVLTNSTTYEQAWLRWHKDQAAPFNVLGHGNSSSLWIDIQGIHPKGLSQANLLNLREQGAVGLNAVQLARLIRTAPGYVKGQHINLFSCECGKELQGIAQQLATRMKVPVSAFTEKVVISGYGLKFGTLSTRTGEYGIMKAFYPDASQHPRLIALASLPALFLSGDESEVQNISISKEQPEPITNISLDFLH